MHNNDFDVILRSVHYSAKQQIANINKNAQKLKLSTQGELGFEFSYKLYLYVAKNLQLCLCIPHPVLRFPMSRYQTGYILSSHE